MQHLGMEIRPSWQSAYLSIVHKAPCLISSTLFKLVCNSSTWQVEAGGSEVRYFDAIWRPCLSDGVGEVLVLRSKVKVGASSKPED